MPYSTQGDIETVYGIQNVAEWSNPENDGTGANAARIAVAIAWSDEQIDNRFRDGPYAIPFTGTIPRVVVDWSARLSGSYLYRVRPAHSPAQDRMLTILNGIDNDIDSYMVGGRKMLAARSSTDPTVPIAVFPGQPYARGSFGVGT